MKQKKAFTLIELLVVVIIIGILAAIALPQYEKAVEKSKATQALTLLKSAYQAAAAHYMATGEYPRTFSEMGFEVPWTGTTKWTNIDVGPSYGVRETKSNDDWSLQLYHASQNELIIYVGRISGKYKGAGFGVTVNSSQTLQPLTIFCAERKEKGIVFGEGKGDYCVKIMNGTYTNTVATYRQYSLP